MKTENKGFVWYGLRIGFLLMLACSLLSIINIIPEDELIFNILYLIIWVFSIFFTFILSIIHLTKYKEKSMSIVALVLSSFLILISIIGLFFITSDSSEYLNSQNITEQEVIDYVDNFCSISCQGLENYHIYDYQYDEETDEVYCYCLDSNYDTILKKMIPFSEE